MNGSSPPRQAALGDSCGQDSGGPFSQKVGRYSAEERKERIERYRVKRHQRNFNKKITVLRPCPHVSLLCNCMFFAIRVSAANVWWSVRVQEDAGRQPAEGEGPVREER
jgi:hypothetical protein